MREKSGAHVNGKLGWGRQTKKNHYRRVKEDASASLDFTEGSRRVGFLFSCRMTSVYLLGQQFATVPINSKTI
jgi:hypothetical protein